MVTAAKLDHVPQTPTPLILLRCSVIMNLEVDLSVVKPDIAPDSCRVIMRQWKVR